MLVDTGAWYALADRSDRYHTRARRFYLAEAAHRRFFTTDVIVAETWTLLQAHISRVAATRFWDTLRTTRIPIVTLEPVDLEAAWRIVQTFPDQTFSFTGCTSFALMERLAVFDVFAFDAHFLVYRFGARRERSFTRWPA